MSIFTGHEIWSLAEKHSHTCPDVTLADAVIDGRLGERLGNMAVQTPARFDRVVFDAPAVN